jgi:hypothetical protein
MNRIGKFAAVAACIAVAAWHGAEKARASVREAAPRLAVAAVLAFAVQFGVMDPALAGGAMIMLYNAPFPVQPELTAIAVTYTNAQYVADAVLPRVMVGKQDFKYTKWALADGFTLPDTKVGRKGRPNEVEFSGTETTASAQAYGLDDPVPQDDILNAPANYDPEAKAVERTTDLVLLDREAARRDARVRREPVRRQQQGDARRCLAVVRFRELGSHVRDPRRAGPRASSARTSSSSGRRFTRSSARTRRSCRRSTAMPRPPASCRAQFLAELLELDEVIVGAGWVNSAKKGQAASLVRVWGKHAVLAYRNKNADTQGGTTFGYTAQWGERLAGSEYDKHIGLRGGQRVRVGEYVKEIICANDLGYMFQNAVA